MYQICKPCLVVELSGPSDGTKPGDTYQISTPEECTSPFHPYPEDDE